MEVVLCSGQSLLVSMNGRQMVSSGNEDYPVPSAVRSGDVGAHVGDVACPR